MLRVALRWISIPSRGGGIQILLLLLALEINLDKLRPDGHLCFLTCMQDFAQLFTILFLPKKPVCGFI